jgi:hypothetical protein
MRLIKMLGLAMVAAIAAMAFIGASSASAVNICETGTAGEYLEEGCPEGKAFAEGTALKAQLGSGTKAILETNLGNVVCNKSAVSGKTGASTEEKLEGSIESVTFEECTLGATKCTVTVEGLPYKALLLLVPKAELLDGLGHLHYHFIIHLGKAKVVCGTSFSCTFGAPEILFNVHFMPPWLLLVKQALERQAGLFCPSSSVWNATYEITAPTINAIAMK